MAKSPVRRLGDLQLRILKVLWNAGSASVAEVSEDLGTELAYTTIATMLRKMEARGLVWHREAGRKFMYEPAVTAEEVSRNSVADLVERLCEGSLADAVSHLLESREVSREELDRLERLIHERKNRTVS